MSIQTTPYGLPFPVWPTDCSGAPANSTSNYLLDASGEKGAAIFKSTVAKDIRKIRFFTGNVTTGDTVDVRIETVGTGDGLPTGTLFAANTNIAHTILDTDDSVWLVTGNLTADAVLAVGNIYAIVIVNGAVGNFRLTDYDRKVQNFPYGARAIPSYAKISSYPIFVPEYSDGTIEPILGYYDQGGLITSTVFNSGSATNARGNIFQIPWPCRTSGCWVWMISSGGDYTINLYDSDGSTVLATTGSIDKDIIATSSGFPQFHPWLVNANLAKNTNYRIAVVPDSASNVTVYHNNMPTAGMLNAFPGGSAMHLSTRASGAWTETTTSRQFIGLFLNGFDDAVPASSGGFASARLA